MDEQELLEQIDALEQERQELVTNIAVLESQNEELYNALKYYDDADELLQQADSMFFKAENREKKISEQINLFEKEKLKNAQEMQNKERELQEREKKVKILMKKVKTKEAELDKIINEAVTEKYKELLQNKKPLLTILIGYAAMITVVALALFLSR